MTQTSRTPALGLVFALWTTAAVALAAENHPFGSHPLAYAAGSIRPDHLSQAVLDQQVRDFYDAWKARFLAQACGAGRYVVVTKTQAGNLTVSEGHGYGMMLAALMAGHDPDARAIFDGMYTYFREHPTATHARLMSFFQTRTCGDAQGQDSATDGDLDIAFALLLADKQWGSCGPIDYRDEALAMLADVADGDLDPTGQYTTLGDWVTPGVPPYADSTRSSDFMPDHYRSFAAAAGGGPWAGLLAKTYAVVDAVQTTHSSTTGLLPDFVTDPLGTPDPAPADFLEGPNDGAYDYNACRDPWRLATDFLVSGDARAHTAVQRMITWIRTATGGDPTAIKSGYQLNGTMSPGADYPSMAFIAPFGAGATVDAANQAWLNAVWDLTVATPIATDAYYENTLKLLSMIVMSGNWWTPEGVSGGCVASPSTPICTGGGVLVNPDVKIGGTHSGPGRQSLSIKGTLFFPQGNPAAAPFTGGAQILLEDLGSGATAIYELSHVTTPVPSAATPGCDTARDRWQAKPTSVTYKNKSGALDPPACTAGSARGLGGITYKPHGAFDLDVQAKGSRTTIATPVGPLRLTWVLGATAADGAAGRCAIATTIPCSAGGSSVRCR